MVAAGAGPDAAACRSDGSPRQRSPQSITQLARAGVVDEQVAEVEVAVADHRRLGRRQLGGGVEHRGDGRRRVPQALGARARRTARASAARGSPCRRGRTGRPGGRAPRPSCSARRNSPNGRARPARWSSDRPSGSCPAGSARRRTATGTRRRARPTNTGAGTGSGSRGASEDSARDLALDARDRQLRGAGSGTPTARRRATPCCPSPRRSAAASRAPRRGTGRRSDAARTPRRP